MEGYMFDDHKTVSTGIGIGYSSDVAYNMLYNDCLPRFKFM